MGADREVIAEPACWKKNHLRLVFGLPRRPETLELYRKRTGGPDASFNAEAVSDRCVTASNLTCSTVRSAANGSRNLADIFPQKLQTYEEDASYPNHDLCRSFRCCRSPEHIC